MLAAAGRTIEGLPSDMQTAFNSGTMSKTTLSRYLSLESNWLTKVFMPLQGAPPLLCGQSTCRARR